MSDRLAPPTYRCYCQDLGFVWTDFERNMGHPCPRCRSEQYAHWCAGGYRPLDQGRSILSLRKRALAA